MTENITPSIIENNKPQGRRSEVDRNKAKNRVFTNIDRSKRQDSIEYFVDKRVKELIWETFFDEIKVYINDTIDEKLKSEQDYLEKRISELYAYIDSKNSYLKVEEPKRGRPSLKK